MNNAEIGKAMVIKLDPRKGEKSREMKTGSLQEF